MQSAALSATATNVSLMEFVVWRFTSVTAVVSLGYLCLEMLFVLRLCVQTLTKSSVIKPVGVNDNYIWSLKHFT